MRERAEHQLQVIEVLEARGLGGHTPN
jgi:hypothetical protein